MKSLHLARSTALCLSLAACAHAISNSGPIYSADTSNLESGRLVCDVNSLSTQKDQVIKERDELRATTAEEKTSTNLGKMKEFDASIDAEYRNVVSSCRAYIQCMEMNHYDETSCQSSETRWRDAETSFSNLSIELHKMTPPPRAPGKPGSGLGKPPPGFGDYGFSGSPPAR